MSVIRTISTTWIANATSITSHARSRASYLAADWMPVSEAGLLDVHADEGPFPVAAGITAERVGGHTRGLSIVRVAGGQDPDVVFVGDLVPTGAHVPVPWVMGYDLQPLVTIEEKKEVYRRCAQEGLGLAFPHDAEVGGVCVEMVDGKPVVCKVLDL